MSPEQRARAESLIARQLAMNPGTVAAARRAGLAPEHEAQLDFSFEAPSRRAARSLVEHLEKNNCLALSADRSGSFFKRRHTVQGKSHPTRLDEDVLEQWVSWMVVQGIIHECTFDGWGVEVCGSPARG